jgi:hypothetical protein
MDVRLQKQLKLGIISAAVLVSNLFINSVYMNVLVHMDYYSARKIQDNGM